jgi:hypothetical protein
MQALFAPGRPLDATRYFLILPDNVGHGKSSKPSDGLKAVFPKYGYRNTFHLNDNEIEMISTLVPKRQALVKRPDLTKVVNLEVDEKSYWLDISDPSDSFKLEQAFREHGFEKGLEVLTRSSL